MRFFNSLKPSGWVFLALSIVFFILAFAIENIALLGSGITFMIIGATFTTRHDPPEDDEISAP